MRTGKAHIAIVGAGEMGRHTLKILAEHLPAQNFLVYDMNEANLGKATAIDPDRIAGEVAEVTADRLLALGGAEVVVNFAGPFYRGSDAVARSAGTAKRSRMPPSQCTPITWSEAQQFVRPRRQARHAPQDR